MDPNQLLPEMQGKGEKRKNKESSSEDSSSSDDSSDDDSSSSGMILLLCTLNLLSNISFQFTIQQT